MNVLKNIISIIILLALSACGGPPTQPETSGIDSSLKPYAVELNRMSVQYTGNSLPIDNSAINFQNLGDVEAFCYVETGEIFVNPTIWAANEGNENKRLAILLHQIGHCIFGLEHDSEIFDPTAGPPPTIMSAGAVSEYYFNLHKEEYFNALWESQETSP